MESTCRIVDASIRRVAFLVSKHVDGHHQKVSPLIEVAVDVRGGGGSYVQLALSEGL